eukprot:9512760-Alexandrium_andersonii.AAC.1
MPGGGAHREVRPSALPPPRTARPRRVAPAIPAPAGRARREAPGTQSESLHGPTAAAPPEWHCLPSGPCSLTWRP